MSGNTIVQHISASGAAHRFDLNGVARRTLTESSWSLASGIAIQAQAGSFPTGPGDKVAAWTAGGFLSSASGISVVASGRAFGFGPRPATAGGTEATRGDLLHSNNTTMTRVQSADGANSLQVFKLDNQDQLVVGETNVRSEFHQVSASGFYAYRVASIEKQRIHASGTDFRATDIQSVRRVNNIDGLKSFGDLSGGAATGIVAVNAGSGTVFAIPASVTTAQLYTLQPSGFDRDALLIQNRSAVTHTIYSAGTPSQALFQINPSGMAWTRFQAGTGTWELLSRHQMGVGT